MIKCLIIEDDLSNQIILRKKIERFYPELEIIEVIDNVTDAIAFLNKEKVDIVFSDMQIIGGTGLDVFRSLNKSIDFEVIYITAHTDFAIQAINIKASYYLVKPIEDNQLIEAMDRVLDNISKTSGTSGILISTKSRQLKLQFKSIYSLKSEGPYTRIFTSNKEILSSKNLGKYELELPKNLFFRAHHSHVVNMEKISKITLGKNAQLELDNGSLIPIAQRRLKELKSHLKET